jgi:Rrf2 family protein
VQLLTRESDYAVRALAALGTSGGHVQVARIAQEQAVPFDFLQKILRKLKTAGFVTVRRGPGGGFALARPPADITLLDVLDAVQGPLTVSQCLLDGYECPMASTCPVRDRLAAVQDSVRSSLAGITLSVLLENAEDSAE